MQVMPNSAKTGTGGRASKNLPCRRPSLIMCRRVNGGGYVLGLDGILETNTTNFKSMMHASSPAAVPRHGSLLCTYSRRKCSCSTAVSLGACTAEKREMLRWCRVWTARRRKQAAVGTLVASRLHLHEHSGGAGPRAL